MKLTVSGILRFGLGITFVWVAILIFQAPAVWAGFLPAFAVNATGLDAETIMVIVALFDAILGFMMILNVALHWVALIAALHLLSILIFSGVDDITVRDVGLFAAALALFVEEMPNSWKKRVQ